MPRPLLRLGQVLMLLVLFAAAGGHWMALQSVAWTTMLVSYSQDGTFAAAVAKTFDGRHPCSLCKVIERADHSGPAQESLREDNQANFLIPSVVTVFVGERMTWELEVPESHLSGRVEQPATPPPRGAVA